MTSKSPRKPVLRLVAGSALAALLVAACGGGATQNSGDDPSPSESASPTTTASGSPSASEAPATPRTVGVYYLGETERGPKLYREFRRITSGGTAIEAAVDAMLHLPALDTDYRSLWPRATRLLGVTVTGDLAVVDFSGEVRNASAGAAYEELSLQQLVHTVTAADTRVRRVQVHVDGSAPENLWGHVDTRSPLTRADRLEVLAAVWIIDPQHGSSVANAFRMHGDATVFEATVNWAVVACASETVCNGAELREGFVTATDGGPGRGTWEVSVTLPAGAPRFVQLRAWESSAEDGHAMFLDSKVVRTG